MHLFFILLALAQTVRVPGPGGVAASSGGCVGTGSGAFTIKACSSDESTMANGNTTGVLLNKSDNTTGANEIVVSIATYNTSSGGAVCDKVGGTPSATCASSDNTYACFSVFGGGALGHPFALQCHTTSTTPTVGSGHEWQYACPGGTPCYPSIYMVALADTNTPAGDQSAGNAAGTSSVTSLQPGSITPTVNNEIVITLLSLANSGSTNPAASGFTLLTSQGGVASFSTGGALAYQVQTTATAVNPTWTWTTSNDATAAQASFK